MRRRIKLWCNQMEKILEQSGAMYFFIDFITVYSRFVSRWPFLCFRQVCTSWCCQNIIKLALATKNNKFYINIMVFANVRNRQRLSRYSVVVVFETNQPQPGWVTIVAMFSFLYKKQGVSLTFIIILLFIGFSFLVKMNGKVQDKITVRPVVYCERVFDVSQAVCVAYLFITTVYVLRITWWDMFG